MQLLRSALVAGLLLTNPIQAQANTTAPCGDVARLIGGKNATEALAVDIPADLALGCLQSVAINKTAATQFIDFFNASMLQFQSTTGWLKDPPSSYQQPAVDLRAGLQKIKQNLDGDKYRNEYDFEADFTKLAQATHDGHFAVFTGGLSVFLFRGPFPIVSVSRDGLEVPQLFASDDLKQHAGSASGWSASPLKQINGQDAVAYITQFAANHSTGGLEGHTDWNSLMTGAAADISGNGDAFSRQSLFLGSAFNVTFANGTISSRRLVARLLSSADIESFKKIKSGSDFYNEFVRLNTSTQTSASVASTASSTSSPTSTPVSAWPNPAFPKPFLIQKNLGAKNTDSGAVSEAYGSAYMVQSISTSILSIPSFSMSGDDAQSFSSFVGEFLKQSKQAGIKRILIDVQANPGGSVLLAFDMFKQFFPRLSPRSNNQIHIHPAANILGTAYSKFVAANGTNPVPGSDGLTDAQELAGNPWIAQNSIDVATGKAFTSWQDIQAGTPAKGDAFSKTQADNFSNVFFDLNSGDIVVSGFANRTNPNAQQLYDAKDIAILTDGLCASTCSVMVDQFKNVGGVRVIAAGGLPKAGLMQGVGGVRGSQAYELAAIQVNVAGLDQLNITLNNSDAKVLAPIIDTGLQVSQTSFNLRNALRENATTPQQFLYEPADCRIYYTLDTWNNYTALWTYAVNALWNNNGLCIQGGAPSKVNGPGGQAQPSGAKVAGGSQSSMTPVSTPRIVTGGAMGLKVSWLLAFMMPAVGMLVLGA